MNEAVQTQLNKLWHTTNIYLHPKIHEYAEQLVATLPGDLKVIYYNSILGLRYVNQQFDLKSGCLFCQQRIRG